MKYQSNLHTDYILYLYLYVNIESYVISKCSELIMEDVGCHLKVLPPSASPVNIFEMVKKVVIKVRRWQSG